MPERDAPNRIHELRLGKKRWNQRELAESVRAHWVTISKLERGQMKLTQEWMKRIAAALEVEPHELISDHSHDRSVYVDGSIEARGFVISDAVDDGDSAVEYHVDIGTDQPNVSLWYFAVDEMFSIIRSGDLLRFTYFHGRNAGEYEGRLCILEFDPPHASMAGLLSAGKQPDTFDIQTSQGRQISGFKPTRVSVLTMIVSSPKIKTDEFGVPW